MQNTVLFVAVIRRPLDVAVFPSEEEARKFVEMHREMAGTWFGAEFRCTLADGSANGRVMGEVMERRLTETANDAI